MHAYLIPAYQAAATLALVLEGLERLDPGAIRLVVDDGSTDGTGDVARWSGAEVVTHAANRGKGAALRTGFARLAELGAETAVTVDADGQHRPEDAVALARHSAPATALVLGVRDLAAAGAPRANQFSNAFSNRWVSWFAGTTLNDTQCGLRRYPVRRTLELGARASGYGFESEIIVRCARAGVPILETPVGVIYPPEELRVSHFHSVRDPTRIVLRLLLTAALVRRRS